MPLVGDALQIVSADVFELEPGTDGEVFDRGADQNLTCVGDCADPGADVDRQATDAVASEMAQEFASVSPPVDAAVLQGEMAAWLAYAIHEALPPGSQGWCDDAFAHVRPWGFEPSDITVPVLLLHGRQDTEVPFGHGQWLAAHIPGIEARLLDNDGHMTLADHIGDVHAWLSERL
jgi:pimeloyl-ACP methyl ester carboxylesterase